MSPNKKPALFFTAQYIIFFTAQYIISKNLYDQEELSMILQAHFIT